LGGEPEARATGGCAAGLHESLSRRIPRYVAERIASGKAQTLSVAQVSATEWPVYGAFFYLLATDNLQSAWDRDRTLADQAPAVTGAEAIEASVRIMLDPGHAHWIRTYWGDEAGTGGTLALLDLGGELSVPTGVVPTGVRIVGSHWGGGGKRRACVKRVRAGRPRSLTENCLSPLGWGWLEGGV